MRILRHPNPALRQRAADVEPTSDRDLGALVQRMANAMYDATGVGLAATQVGVQKRVIVYDLEDDLVVLCNPSVASCSGETCVEEEGCLSLPGLAVPVTRPASIVCEAQGLDGSPLKIEADEWLARVLQHEIDHLDGVLIIDRLSPEERKAAVRRYNEGQTGSDVGL